MKISVVITTYNGEKCILEQLQSILEQTVPANEVLIFDDRSTDFTYSICQEFIKQNKLYSWSLTLNEKNLGFEQNFFNGFTQASGDLIFIADQDDIWCNNKIEVMSSIFSSNHSILSLTSTFSRFNENIILSNHVIHPHRKKNGLQKVTVSDYCKFHSYLGMSTCFDKRLLSYIQSEYTQILTYDILINYISVINNGLYHLDQVLVKRRSYPESVSGISGNQLLNEANGNTSLCNASYNLANVSSFSQIANDKNSPTINIINKYKKHSNKRYNYLLNRNIWSWIKNIIYLKYYNSYKQYYNDGLSLLKSRLPL